MRRFFARAVFLLKLAACLAVVSAAERSDAALRNRYSFTTDATDSIAGQNGILIGSNGSFTGGQLVLANTGQGSQDPGADGAYLDLPNGIISSAAAAGTSGALTVEMWLTMQTNRDWAAAFSAGNSINGEGTADCCNDDQPYIQIIPRSGDSGQGNDFRVTTNSYGGSEGWVDDNGAGNGTDLTVGKKEHVVAVFDQSAGAPGNVTVYRNGSLVGTSPIAANLNLSTFKRANNTGGDVNIWLGRSQWPDSLAAASYDELRIYSHALTAQEALVDAVFGPDVVGATGIPSIEVNKLTGAITLKNNATAPLKLEYYSITSAAGALKTSSWSSLDDQNYNAIDGNDAGTAAGDSPGEGWDEAGGSNTHQLIEYFLGLNGSVLAPNAALNLGNAYNPALFAGANGDLVFQFAVPGVPDGSLFTAPVIYVNTLLPGDYNHNGVVDAGDYVVWRKTLGQTGSGLNADGDNNGVVNGDDYAVWRANFGVGSGSASVLASAAVPEPAALALIGLLGVSVLACRGAKLAQCSLGSSCS